MTRDEEDGTPAVSSGPDAETPFQRLQQLFLRAKDLQGAALRNFVARECASEPGVRADLLRLLAIDSESFGIQGLIGELAQALNEQTDSDGRGPDNVLSAGLAVGGYKLLDKLGQGGMGVVFRARDTRLARHVAIKFMSQQDVHLEQRFLAEARATARCEHRNIVAIHEVDEYVTADSRRYPYMVLEYLEGPTLRDILAVEAMDTKRALTIVRPVIQALSCAHAQGIVHRDLKPENIILTEREVVKVLDFGIAKVRSGPELLSTLFAWKNSTGGDPTDSLQTRVGALLGTLQYMSPEQWNGAEIDHRADIWAVGVILHELLTGHRPLDEAQLAHLGDHSVPVPSLAENRPDLGMLAEVVDRCLDKNRERRPSSAARLLGLLDAAQSVVPAATDRDTANRPEGTGPSAPGRGRRTRVLVASGVVLLALALSTFGYFWPALSIPRLHAGTGVVVVSKRIAGGEVRDAHAKLVGRLQAFGASYVRSVDLPYRSISDDELLAAADAAGAALLVLVEDGPQVRVLPVQRARSRGMLASLPAVRIDDDDTIDALAPVLFLASWSATLSPTAVPMAADDGPTIGELRRLGPEYALTAVYLLDMAGQLSGERTSEARSLVAEIVQTCTESMTRPFCRLAFVLYYIILCPDCPGAVAWLDTVPDDRDEDALSGAALLHLMPRRCHTDHAWVYRQLVRWNGALNGRSCRRLALAVPATCLSIERGYADIWLARLARPQLAAFGHCGDLRVRVLAEQAASHGRARQWAEAAQRYMRAAELAPADPAHLLNWAAMYLLQYPDGTDGPHAVLARIDPEVLVARVRAQAEFLRWLAADSRLHAQALCTTYGEVSTATAAMPELGALETWLCEREEDRRCRVYQLLVSRKPDAGGDALCELLNGPYGAWKATGTIDSVGVQ